MGLLFIIYCLIPKKQAQQGLAIRGMVFSLCFPEYSRRRNRLAGFVFVALFLTLH
jgi:hypothetical protein